MKFICGLGVAFVLAGATLMLPRVANGAPCPQVAISVSQPVNTVNYIVSENPGGVAIGPGITESVPCDISQINFSTSYDLLQSSQNDTVASDSISLRGAGASTTVTFTSDPGEAPEATLPRLTSTPCA